MRRAAGALAARLHAAAGMAAAPPSCGAARALATSPAAAAPVHPEDELYNRQRQLLPLGARVPSLAPDAWVAPSAALVGDVDLYERAVVWHGAVLRGDLNAVRVGAFSSVGPRAVLHAARSAPTGLPAATVVGRSVVVGARCLLRSATVQDECVLGERCVLLEGSLVETHSVLAAGSVLPPGRRVPSGQLWAGAPARYVRDLTKDEVAGIAGQAAAERARAEQHAAEEAPRSTAWREAEELRAALAEGAPLKESWSAEALAGGAPAPAAAAAR